MVEVVGEVVVVVEFGGGGCGGGGGAPARTRSIVYAVSVSPFRRTVNSAVRTRVAPTMWRPTVSGIATRREVGGITHS